MSEQTQSASEQQAFESWWRTGQWPTDVAPSAWAHRGSALRGWLARAALAQQPAAQPAGLADDEIARLIEQHDPCGQSPRTYQYTRAVEHKVLSSIRAAAQAAGLTDDAVSREQIEAWARRAWIVGSGVDGALTEPDIVRLGDFAIAAREPLLSRAAPSGNAAELAREELEALHMCLDDAGVPRENQSGLTLSAWGRVMHYADPQPSAQQAEPESPMKAAADALRRKTELEQAHQDGYRDGFKAAQAMLAKAEHPAEEARGVDGGLMEAIRRYAFLFALHTQNNTDASRAEADAALARVRALLATPPAGDAGQESDRLVEQFFAGNAAFNLGYAKGLEDSQYRRDAERFRWLIDESGEFVWYPPGYNGAPAARFDFLWHSEESDIRKAIDAAIEASKGERG